MLDFAINVAKKTGLHALKYFEKSAKVTFKADNSPVTRADQEAELIARDLIGRKFPSHGIIGEEHGSVNADAKYVWAIDPVDGTRDFVRDIPFWATFVCLLENGKPITSAIYFPTSDELITAQKNKGSYLNSKRLKVSTTNRLEEAYISAGQIKRFVETKKVKQLEKLAKKISASRSYGNLGLKYLLEGKIDGLLESTGKIYDFAAPALSVTEAGGKFSDFEGGESLTTGNMVLTNKLIHNQVLNILNSK